MQRILAGFAVVTRLQGGLGVISYFSLAKGFLTGKYRTEADLAKSVRGHARILPRSSETGVLCHVMRF